MGRQVCGFQDMGRLLRPVQRCLHPLRLSSWPMVQTHAAARFGRDRSIMWVFSPVIKRTMKAHSPSDHGSQQSPGSCATEKGPKEPVPEFLAWRRMLHSNGSLCWDDCCPELSQGSLPQPAGSSLAFSNVLCGWIVMSGGELSSSCCNKVSS